MTTLEDGHDYSQLRGNVSALGRLLGETIAEADGPEFLQLIERIRLLSRSARQGDEAAQQELLDVLVNLRRDQLVPVARAFSQFLNLANIADQQYTVSRQMDSYLSASAGLKTCFKALRDQGFDAEVVANSVGQLKMELVLTAHPTEITRRTLIHKHGEISHCLGQLELSGLTERETDQLHQRLRELLTQIWYGYDFREERPTPVDEAKWGFAVVEDSLWRAVPEYLRRLDTAVSETCGIDLPLDATPVSFLSWMGGDRDGNPNVTAAVTQEVLLLARWQAADLYLRDVIGLIDELSMTACDDTVREMAGDAQEPYRAVLRPLRKTLRRTLRSIGRELGGMPGTETNILLQQEQLWEPLLACYESMVSCGMAVVANRGLLDLLRRVRCFGVHLVRLDIRQDSARHLQVLSELTRYLDLGDYAGWSESEKTDFLLQELTSRRPLIPPEWEPSPEVKEVLDTCAVVAAQSPQALGSYVISMARQASDVLAVHLLLKISGCQFNLPVAPLFETLDDLERARSVVERLLGEAWYKEQINGKLMIMIGYSDSSKDAGVLAASWAQYRAQEQLLAVCDQHGVELTLFHGRGGTIGRGGAPAHDALLSQPPGSLRNGLRVTEQGEMIRAKLGLTSLAVKTLALYTGAICTANLVAPPTPKAEWCKVMDSLSTESCRAYRAVVRDNPDFVAYFRYATPEQELAKLPLGSRPARRKSGGGIESLRAIPWIFAWMQNRLMLPAWLGVGEALANAVQQGQGDTLKDMLEQWPFFATRLSMQEMVFAKADAGLSAYYDQRLVPQELQGIGDALREQLTKDQHTLQDITGSDTLLEGQAWLRESLQLRDYYTDPLHYLQVELLHRERNQQDEALDQAIMVTIAGIAAGMRNTG